MEGGSAVCCQCLDWLKRGSPGVGTLGGLIQRGEGPAGRPAGPSSRRMAGSPRPRGLYLTPPSPVRGTGSGDGRRSSDSPWRLSWARRGEQSASEEPILDSGELRAPLTLTELEPARRLERSEDVRVGVPLGQPRAGRNGEFGCEVAFFHCRESRGAEQACLLAAGGDRSWSGAYRSPTSGRSETFCYIDRR